MRFTKIPLIATLMAVALSLLIVLPTLAQVSGDRTDGRLSVGDWIDVRIAGSLTGDIGEDNTETVRTNSAYAVNTAGVNQPRNDYEAKDTYFNGDLYVSNKEAAYNTILISAKVAGDAGVAPLAKTRAAGADLDADNPEPCANATSAAVATITNTRSNTKVTAYLVNSGSTEQVDGNQINIYHGIVAVWDQEASIESQSGPCAVHGDPVEYVGSADQTTDAETADSDGDIDIPEDDPLTEDVDERIAFIRGYIPEKNRDGWTDASAAVIPARDGDTLTITVKGVAGAISVVVDGDKPEIEAIAPANKQVTRENTVNLGFTVSDDGSGLRYDQESGASGDPDLSPYNGDGDQRFDEPISQADPTHNPGADPSVIEYGDGGTADIKIYYDDDNKSAILPYLDGNAAPTSEATRGTAPDIVNNDPNPAFTGVAMFFDVADDETSSLGGNDWTQVSKGEEYSLDMRITGNDFGTYYWQVTVKDRVGNSATTDGDEDTDGNQPFRFTVDDAGPIVASEGARTGVSYVPGDGEKANRAWIALEFINDGIDDPVIRDRIDASTVEPGDFTVGGHTVIQALVPSETKCETSAAKTGEILEDIDGNCLTSPGSRIYLQLSADLASDATPTIQLLGGAFKDIAGNNNITDSFKAVDKIAPGIDITITSSTGTANRAAAGDPDDDSFTVRVTSDEDLSRFPRLYFATIKGKASITGSSESRKVGNATDLTIADLSSKIDMTEVDTNTWEKKVKFSNLPSQDNGILAVIITAADEASPEANPGNSAGWKGSGTPAASDGLDFKKLDAGGFLVEIDNILEKAAVTVRPAADPADPGANETESGNPYIELNFAEADEYDIPVTDDKGTTAENAPEMGDDDYVAGYEHDADDEDGRATKVDIGDGDTLRIDSHRAVTLTALAINGEDRLADVVKVDPWKYVLAVTGLEIGEYDITYAAMDDVGNEVDEDAAEASFEVLERQPYEIKLDPGWNLISLPGDPFNPAVGSVIGEDLKADTVLGYQGGEWVTSVRNEDGRWQGTLTDMVGGYGYWVRTTVVETIETVIPPVLPTSVLPTVRIVAGWNLIGIVDPEQYDVDNAKAAHDADEYLTSLGKNWRVAYSFETQQNSWAKLLPNAADANVQNGKGYWLWNVAPGTLVP